MLMPARLHQLKQAGSRPTQRPFHANVIQAAHAPSYAQDNEHAPSHASLINLMAEERWECRIHTVAG